jgi:hypothetical protein
MGLIRGGAITALVGSGIAGGATGILGGRITGPRAMKTSYCGDVIPGLARFCVIVPRGKSLLLKPFCLYVGGEGSLRFQSLSGEDLGFACSRLRLR